MENRVLDEVLKELGLSGVKHLCLMLSGPHHNREVAKQFDLTLWQVRVCNQFLITLYHFVLEKEMIPENVFYLKNNLHKVTFPESKLIGKFSNHGYIKSFIGAVEN